MGDPVTINLRHVGRGLGVPLAQVQAVIGLLDEGNTIPFITRYRKDQTGGLDEEQIRQIAARLTKLRMLAERKQTILRSIEAQGKLSEKLSKQIRGAATAKRLEDLYLPYKPKKQTLATVARSRGLEPLAQEILAAEKACQDLDARAADFVNPDRQVPTVADVLLGAGHILAEQFSERADFRQRLREILQASGKLVSVRVGGETKGPSTSESANEAHQGPEGSAGTAGQPVPAVETPPAEKPQPVVEPSADEKPQPVVEPNVADKPETAGSAPDTAQDRDAAIPTDTQESGTSPPRENSSVVEDAANPEQAANPERAAPPGAAESAGQRPPRPASKPKPKQRLSKKELKKKKAEERLEKAFSDYFDYREEMKRVPPHRVLAINRGERAKVLRVKIEYDLDQMRREIDELCVAQEHPHAGFLRGCACDALDRLILPSLEREARRELTERAETQAVGVFARNLRNLLLQPPVRDRRVLAIDPGYRSGCKLAALDQFGNMLEHGVIHLVGRPERKQKARQTVIDMVRRFGLSVVVIGNGAACRDAEDFFASLIGEEIPKEDLAYVIVNEAGASVYSTSRLAREEFPEYDASLRGAISIGRRLQDPLSELVKIGAASIGVGLYQHDVKAKHLRDSLDEVVESCVNHVGVDVNTASPALLRYVSGLNQLTAQRVYEHRREHGPFRSRAQLREVPGFGEATFVQAAGFLRITGGQLPVDATWIHPENYEVATKVLERIGATPDDLITKDGAKRLAEAIGNIDVAAVAAELQVGELLLKDILAQLARPGRDPREDLPAPVFKHGVLKLDDLAQGMELTGTVLNVVDFGAFIDIGMHDSGLVHVSQLADRFVRDPHEVVAVGDIVRVWVLGVDKQRRRVSLTMIEPGKSRADSRREGRGDKPAKGRTSGRPARSGAAAGGSSRGDANASRGGGGGRSGGGHGRGRGQGSPARKGAGSKGKGPPKPRHRSKPPRPATPITENMKSGKEPMRSFSDLAQFFQPEPQEPEEKTQKKGKPNRDKPKPPSGERAEDKDTASLPTPETPQASPAESDQEQVDAPGVAGPPVPTHPPVPADSTAPVDSEDPTASPMPADPKAPSEAGPEAEEPRTADGETAVGPPESDTPEGGNDP